MCGILGVLSRQTHPQANLEHSFRLLFHRGPDDHGTWSDEYITLGHTRLSILDLSALGHQPMSYNQGRYQMTFNGEIYNYLELRRELAQCGHEFISQSDSEVLLAAYGAWGCECVHKLRGMFAFAIWDTHTKRLFLARDRMGEKPLYYWRDEQTYYFASELKALIALLPFTPELDPSGLDFYLHHNYVPEPRTPCQGIRKLPAAHYLTLDWPTWDLTLTRYWGLDQIAPRVAAAPVDRIREELHQVIALTLRSDVPVGVALSGGIDSGAIAALAATKYQDTLQTFSVGYPGGLVYDEREQARNLAKSLRLPFYEVELRTEELVEFFPDLVMAMDDPIADISAYGYYAVMKLARQHGVKVMLSGFGGDELFWGYPWVVNAVRRTTQKQKLLRMFPHVPWWVWSAFFRFTISNPYQALRQNRDLPHAVTTWLTKFAEKSAIPIHLAHHYPNQIIFYDVAPDFQGALHYQDQLYTPSFRALLPERNAFSLFETDIRALPDIPNYLCQLLFETWLMSNCIALGDRMSMASSVEMRLPFVEHGLVELVVGLRKAHSDLEYGSKFWLKEALQGILPAEVLNRPKQGFQPPIEEWRQAIIRRYFPLLESGTLIARKIIAADLVKQLGACFADCSRDTFLLYKLVLLEIWYRKVVLQEI